MLVAVLVIRFSQKLERHMSDTKEVLAELVMQLAQLNNASELETRASRRVLARKKVDE